MAEYTQAGRPMRLDTPLGEDVLLLEQFSGAEGLSQQYSYHARAVSLNPAIAASGVLHKPVVITVFRNDGSGRFFHGIVNRLTRLERANTLTTYEIDIVPWTWFLLLKTDCRIFKKRTVKQILEQIFTEMGAEDFRFSLTGSYEEREYCVQYRETSLDFISRLMEEEGMFYFFEHTKDKHTLVISDSQADFKACEPDEAEYGLAPETTYEKDFIQTVSAEETAGSEGVSMTDFDFENPRVKLDVRGSERYDVYEYPGRYLTRDAGEHYATIRREEQRTHRSILTGSGNCRQFETGKFFTLTDISRQTPAKRYLLIALGHSASANAYRSSAVQPFEYDNHFTAIPAETPYRAPRSTRKPLISGTQTAIVVGPSNEEFNVVDSYGRVEVHFHWDREEKNSCPVRVSQSLAGKNWGVIHMPRIGQEVVVDFLDGDPDRPLIVGRVYNAEQMPPYSLPANQTVAGIKSRSSKGGGPDNYSEIVIDDKKGSEKIRVHAEKDMQSFVEQTRFEYIGKDRHLVVDGSQAEQVGGDKHLTVSGEQRESVGGNVSLTASGKYDAKVGSIFSMESGQEIHLKGGMKVIIEAGMQLSLVGAGGFIDIGPSGVTIQGTQVLINSGGSHGSGTSAQPQIPKKAEKPPE